MEISLIIKVFIAAVLQPAIIAYYFHPLIESAINYMYNSICKSLSAPLGHVFHESPELHSNSFAYERDVAFNISC